MSTPRVRALEAAIIQAQEAQSAIQALGDALQQELSRLYTRIQINRRDLIDAKRHVRSANSALAAELRRPSALTKEELLEIWRSDPNRVTVTVDPAQDSS